jgi:hypothetical protein
VLYELGYVRPELVSAHTSAFLKLLSSKNNRLVWGGMIALSTVASLAAEAIFKRADDIVGVMERGSVITVDNGVKTLARVAATKPRYAEHLFPYLLNHLKTCREKDVPQHAEHVLAAVNAGNKDAYIAVITRRLSDAPASAAVAPGHQASSGAIAGYQQWGRRAEHSRSAISLCGSSRPTALQRPG